VHATIYSLNDEGEDKIIKMYGYIYDTISENPNKLPVQAKMVLESQPYASEIGIITSNDSSGYYEYYINMSKNYIIIVKSEHHSSYTEHLDPTKITANEEIIRNYYLQPEIRENQVIRLKKLIFEQGKANITPESFQELNRLAVLMNENPSMQIQLEGHTDYRGSKKLNMELSQQRVGAVKAYLTGKSINARRIKT
jgi:outer membrane protein OmpA-like peptidoglycan-associated protein